MHRTRCLRTIGTMVKSKILPIAAQSTVPFCHSSPPLRSGKLATKVQSYQKGVVGLLRIALSSAALYRRGSNLGLRWHLGLNFHAKKLERYASHVELYRDCGILIITMTVCLSILLGIPGARLFDRIFMPTSFKRCRWSFERFQ